MRMRCSFLDNKLQELVQQHAYIILVDLQLFELYLLHFADIIMSSDTISVMRHNNSCGKTLLDNWVEEVRI